MYWLRTAGVLERCELVHGFSHELPTGANFDIAISIFVAHFVKKHERLAFLKDMSDRLRMGGQLVNAEISFDLNSPGFPSMLKDWEGIQALMGATKESLANLPTVLRDILYVLPPKETEDILSQCGIRN